MCDNFKFVGKKVAILTSGGDSQGMNSAIRGAGRTILSLGGRCFVSKWGYQGLVQGGDDIVEYSWGDLGSITHLGGTVLGSARCQEFYAIDGRKKAAYNLISRGINHLIVIGGDGSLTGANKFRMEWPTFLEEFVAEKKITPEQRAECQHLSIVGMVGSIDNDFCGTDMTIGTDSALHRIIDCADSIITTAESHQRAFVLEIMGRRSGYLALIAGIAVGADYIFFPEAPPPEEDWQEKLCDTLRTVRSFGKKYSIVIVAEGAHDIRGRPISSQQVKECLTSCLCMDTRVTVLGHIQRGGSPSAFDRILACRQGIEAAINVLISKPEDPSYVICIRANAICRAELDDCISKCNEIKASYSNLNFSNVCQLRGRSFQKNLKIFTTLRALTPSVEPRINSPTFAVLHVGAPAAGMDPCTRAFAKWCISNGHPVIGFKHGMTGVVEENYINLTWSIIEPWFHQGGSSLGTCRATPSANLHRVSEVFKKLGIGGLAIVGGYDGLLAVKELMDARKSYDAFKIPLILIPATISNSLPCTSYTLGSDTTLNVITKSCDALRLSAQSCGKRIFVVETMGKGCGYLATMSAISSAAENAYIREETLSICDILKDVNNIKEKLMSGISDFALLVMSDGCSEYYDVNFVSSLINAEAKPHIKAFTNVLGYIQQGSSASPFDRFFASKFGTKTAEEMARITQQALSDPSILDHLSSACMIGSQSGVYGFTDVDTVLSLCNQSNRCATNPWWISIRNILSILSRAEYTYSSETVPNFVIKNVPLKNLCQGC